MPLMGYQPGSSWLHRLHQGVKGGTVIVGIVAVSIHRSGLIGTCGFLVLLLFLAWSAGIDGRRLLAGLQRLWLLLVLIGAANLIRSDLAGVGIWMGALDGVGRVVGVFLAASLFVCVTSQSELMAFWEGCFQPLGIMGIPARELALVMVIALRFLPVILNELERIRWAQMARGASFPRASSWFAAVRFVPLLVPTLVLSIHRAGELAIAMEARGYCLSGRRTRFRQRQLTTFDVLLAVGIGCGGVLWVWLM
jgi:energy-coupling factor transport system permease protein